MNNKSWKFEHCPRKRFILTSEWIVDNELKKLISDYYAALRRDLEMGNGAPGKRIRKIRKFACHPAHLQEQAVLEEHVDQGNWEGEVTAVLPGEPAGGSGQVPSHQRSGSWTRFSHGTGKLTVIGWFSKNWVLIWRCWLTCWLIKFNDSSTDWHGRIQPGEGSRKWGWWSAPASSVISSR